MDTNGKNCNSDKIGFINKPVSNVDLQNVVSNGPREEDDESELLLPSRRGGLSTKSGKPQRKVQWNDKNGNKLAEVLEFQSSDASDSDEEDSDFCICSIM